MIIDGKKIASDILEKLKASPKPTAFLAAIFVGDDAASASFLKQKKKTADELGVDFGFHQLPASLSKTDLLAEVKNFADDPACGGIIVQLPFPNRADEQEILDSIPRQKDIDILGCDALMAFYAGESDVLPPAVSVVIESLRAIFPDPTALFRFLISSSVAVIGAGRLVGQPVAGWLKGKVKDFIVLDKGDDFTRLQFADLIICGAGAPGCITSAMIKSDSIVIDFGYGVKDSKTMGDLDPSFSPAENISYTPTPGGTGPILVAKLFENFCTLTK